MKKTAAIDLASIDTVAACNQGVEVELRHPATNEPLGIFWTVLGRDSDTYNDYIRDKVNAMLRKKALAEKRGRDLEIRTLEDAEAENIETLIVCSTGWRTGDKQVICFGGQELEFNVANAKKILTERAWIRKQLDEAIGDLSNFMPS